MAEKQMEIEYEKREDVEVFRLKGHLNNAYLKKAKNVLDPPIYDVAYSKILLNFENTIAIDSSILGLLVFYHKRMIQRDAQFALCALSPNVAQVMKATQMDKMFSIYEDENTALKEMSSS
ncbi:STAS domain-containing protein [Deltaproteobacteria bacterium TL4]